MVEPDDKGPGNGGPPTHDSGFDSSRILEAALRYASLGLKVFPCYEAAADGGCACGVLNCDDQGKHPRTKSGYKDATSDTATIRRWWKTWPDSNIAVACGLSGIAVVDSDPRHGGDESLRDLQAKLARFPDTVRALTGGGGEHYFFKRPPNGLASRNHVFPGVDIKCDGGYVIVAPSNHKSGGTYEWEADHALGEVAFAELPQWFLDAVASQKNASRDDAADDAAPIPQGKRNATLTSLAGTMRRRGMSQEAMHAALLVVNAQQCRPPLDEGEVRKIAASIATYPAGTRQRRKRHAPPHEELEADIGENGDDNKVPPPGAEGEDEAGGPVIFIDDRHLHEIATNAWDAVADYNHPEPRLFLHGSRVARVQRHGEFGPRIEHLSRTQVKGSLDRLARWFKHTQTDIVKVRPPLDVVEDMMGLPSPLLPLLNGIIGLPALSSSGRIETAPGYQPATQLWYEPPVPPLPELPAVPSWEDVTRAQELLDDWLCDFPFVNQASRANAIAVVITVAVREVIGPNAVVPFFLYDATTEGTGKGLLANTTAVIATGRGVLARTYNRDGEFMRKAITSILLQAPPLALLDNLHGRIHSPELEALLTSPVWSDRLLGESLDLTLPNRTGWLGTANNAALSRDLVRRTVLIRMDSGLERPYDRPASDFRHPALYEYVIENRHRLAWAVLVLVQNWVAKGIPAWSGTPMGSFERWSRVVGGVLEAADIMGFLDNRSELRERADPESDEMHAVVRAWWDKFRDDPVLAFDLALLVLQHQLLPGIVAGTRNEGGVPDANLVVRMGRKLADNRDRRFGDWFIRIPREHSETGANLYMLEFAYPRDTGSSPDEEENGAVW